MMAATASWKLKKQTKKNIQSRTPHFTLAITFQALRKHSKWLIALYALISILWTSTCNTDQDEVSVSAKKPSLLVNQGTTCPQYPLHLRESGWYFWPLLRVNLGILRIEAQRNWRLNSSCQIKALVIPWETGIYCTITDLINCAACSSCRDSDSRPPQKRSSWVLCKFYIWSNGIFKKFSRVCCSYGP